MGHFPVMLKEVMDYFSSHNGGIYVDATFGGGGHTRTILNNLPDSHVIALDRDHSMTSTAKLFEEEYGERFKFFNRKFSEIEKALSELNVDTLDGALFDVGVSSMQLDNGNRGFSFNKEGPLTMQMGYNKISAYDVVNNYSEESIADILFKYGEEKSARRIAKAICESRIQEPIKTTVELAEIVSGVKRRTGKIHPATLTFQGLRVYVNDELGELEKGLESAIKNLAVNGKVIVITFQGLEDIVTKKVFKSFTLRNKTNKYVAQASEVKIFRKMHNGVIKPSFEEQKMEH